MDAFQIIQAGLKYAQNDLTQISKFENYDVKPKEDQIKCCLYRAFSESNYLVKIESSYSRNGERCDLVAIDQNNKMAIAIEIKTSWAGTGWNNKPKEQQKTWYKDIEKLKRFKMRIQNISSYFILCFIYESDSMGQERLRDKINELDGFYLKPFSIAEWNGLNKIQFNINKIT